MTEHAELARQLDAILAPFFPANQPGAAVLVTCDGEVLIRKGYGLANLELETPVEPHMVFRLGSITKQFTAVSILMLQEQGLLEVSDEIARYLPDFPLQGHCVTIAHLLTHTSGIKSYTDLPEWLSLWRKDMALSEIIDLFKEKPFEFEPGEKFKYCNSGYILLGAIIEKVAGVGYADFVKNRIFEPLGMSHSLYDDPARIVPGRAAGYSRGLDGWINAPYLSMTQPYAAGSLASSVDDLALWDAALYGDQLVRPETLALAFRPASLANGDSTGYGFGWICQEYEGNPVVLHGGGINGFATTILRMPANKVCVVILSNNESPAFSLDSLALKLAGQVIGKPVVAPAPIHVPEEILACYTGVYQINEAEERLVTVSNGMLYSQRTGGRRMELVPYAPDAFLIKETDDRLFFTRDADGAVDGMTIKRMLGPQERAPRTGNPLPAERAAIALAPERLALYTGRYELGPGFVLQISRCDGQLFIQAPGQEKLALFAESETILFTREVTATITFVFGEGGRIETCTFQQGLESYPLKKL